MKDIALFFKTLIHKLKKRGKRKRGKRGINEKGNSLLKRAC